MTDEEFAAIQAEFEAEAEGGRGFTPNYSQRGSRWPQD